MSDQLKLEIGPTHILHGKTMKTLAKRQDNDDVLFLVDNEKFAVVHMTWTKQRQTDHRWPKTQLYDNWDELYKRILEDKEAFE